MEAAGEERPPFSQPAPPPPPASVWARCIPPGPFRRGGQLPSATWRSLSSLGSGNGWFQSSLSMAALATLQPLSSPLWSLSCLLEDENGLLHGLSASSLGLLPPCAAISDSSHGGLFKRDASNSRD